ncbi:MAG: hypothetical protein JRH20_25100 [Deltaproteobacteria bacterium]|nr:hypothetical protein [Deltaproteobacteria bacterium]
MRLPILTVLPLALLALSLLACPGELPPEPSWDQQVHDGFVLDRFIPDPASCDNCSPGQDCIDQRCQCVPDGSCEGCCAGDVCVMSTTFEQCGMDGAACEACTPPSADTCYKGRCYCGEFPWSRACAADKVCLVGACV